MADVIDFPIDRTRPPAALEGLPDAPTFISWNEPDGDFVTFYATVRREDGPLIARALQAAVAKGSTL